MKHCCEFVKKEGKNVTFKFNGFIPNLEEGKQYGIDLKEYKQARSSEQNRLMWAIIGELAQATGNDEMDIYIAGLIKIGVKCDYLIGLPEVEEDLKKSFRAVKIVNYRELNGKQVAVFKVWFGSSKFDTAEMTQLIDYFQGKYFDLAS